MGIAWYYFIGRRIVVHGVPKEFNLPNALATPMPMFE
jgi:hypothetical protein